MLLMLLACGKDGSDSGTVAAVDCAEVTTWGTVGAPFIYTWCTPCHSPTLTGDERQGAPEGVDFATYADVVAYADRIEDRVFSDTAPMPPAGGPSPAELEDVAAWLSCGLPE